MDPCQNGICNKPNTCSCKDGFQKNQEHNYICDPICKRGCVNALCVKPDECECFSGYIKHGNDTSVCKPICSLGSRDPDCVWPERSCAPACDGGCTTNSICIAPNQCSCKEGFKNSTVERNTCSPICSNECINSNCTAPENCECFPGFKKDENDPNKCLPFCSNECLNGLCTDPEVCTCLWGFQSVGSSSNCTRSNNSSISYSLKGKLTSSEGEVLSSLNISEIAIFNGNNFVNLLLTTNKPYFPSEESVITLNCSSNNNPDSEIQNVEVVFECEIETVTRVTKTKTSDTTGTYYQKNEINSLETKKIKNETSFELIINALSYIEKEKIRNDYFDKDTTEDVKHWCLSSNTTKG